jgi:hypothetical protein
MLPDFIAENARAPKISLSTAGSAGLLFLFELAA